VCKRIGVVRIVMKKEVKRPRDLYLDSKISLDYVKDSYRQSSEKITKRRKISSPGDLMVLSIITEEENTSMILPHLFVGGYCGFQDDIYSLASHGIQYVVNCSGKRRTPSTYPESFKFFEVEIDDCPSFDLSDSISTIIPIIQDAKVAGKKCLIYCNIGMSRSVSLALAYLVLSEGMSLIEAMELVKKKRRIASPNPGFMMQLIALEKTVNKSKGGQTTVDIVKYRHDRFGDISFFRDVENTLHRIGC